MQPSERLRFVLFITLVVSVGVLAAGSSAWQIADGRSAAQPWSFDRDRVESSREGPMATITPEQRQEIEKAGEVPVRVEDPETKTAYLIVREDVYRRLQDLIMDHDDESFFEFGEFYPDK